MARTPDQLPHQSRDREEHESMLTRTAERLVPLHSEDGIWRGYGRILSGMSAPTSKPTPSWFVQITPVLEARVHAWLPDT